MSVAVDAKERHRIEHEGLHDTLFVEAGAGTGKTHELVERVVNLVVEAGVSLRTIAAITFTEAAAAELRDRVREAFELRLASTTIGDEERAACRQAMAEIDQAAIGTLHGFCLRILGEHPLDVDLPPRVEILDEVASQLAFQERWNTFVDRLYEDPSCHDLVLRAWALGIEIDAANPAKASFKDVASVFEDSWDRLDGLLARPSTPALDAIDVSGVRSALAALEAVMPTCTVAGDRLLGRCLEVVASVPAVLAEADPLRQLAQLRARSDGWRVGNQRGVKGNWANVEAARSAVDAVGAAARVVLDAASDQVLRQLATRLAHFTVEAAESRRAVGHLVFHDLLVLARRLLRTSADARAELHAKYDRLLLDEFQDTDPIQIEVAVLIASAVASGSADADAAWEEIATEPGRLFFVGDPKQSIYRFRRADIGLFLAARDRFSAEAGGTVVLGQNFRTVATVLDWVNSMFGALMPEEVPACQPAYLPLTADRPDDSGADHRVLVLGGAREGRAGDLREAEAAAVARTIASVGADPDAWPVFDGGRWRAPRWEDVTILVPTRTSLRQLEDALDFAGVPYRVATGSLVFDTQEVREALDALRAIDDPGDELALVSALRSPLYACSDVDLFTYHRAGGRWDLRQEGGVEGLAPGHPVVAALEHLRSLADARWWSEPSALLDRLLRERNAFALAFGSRRPREVWRRLRFIVDQARAYEESAGGGGLRGFLAWAELQRTEGTRVHEPLMAETDDDAVSIFTSHGAKGLEFPITVLSGMTTAARGRRKGPQVFWDGDVPEVRFNKDTSTDNFDRLADIEAEMDGYERLRLLYVACTRARDHLVVSAFHKPAKQASYGELVARHTEGLVSCRRRYEAAADDVVDDEPAPVAAAVPSMPLTLPFDDREGWMAEREALLAPQRRPRFVSATTIAADAVASPSVGGEDGEGGAEMPWRRGRAGTAIGRAVHAVLQVVEPGSVGIEQRVRELAVQQAHVEAVPQAVDTIVALVRSALGSPTVRTAHAAERHWRELYVAAPIRERAVEGYVDLLYQRADGGLVLVDYKTDAVVDGNVDRYALQIAAYAVALEVSTGLVVDEARLVFCTEGEAIERVVPDLEDAKRKVRDVMA